MLVFNKLDLLDNAEGLNGWRARHPDAVAVSARSGAGLEGLKATLVERLDLSLRVVRLRFPAGAEQLAGLFAVGRVLSQEQVGDEQVEVEAELPSRWLARFEEYRIA